ncbi:Iron dicitrate transport regulator FecR [Planctomycetales bacterium 10988]|nr:Iron dicitrate transport regulator FecR [Planctomycetales bacterium 10988]
MDDRTRQLIYQLIDGAISPEDFDRLQDAMEADEEVRQEYLLAVHLNESLQEIAETEWDSAANVEEFPGGHSSISITKNENKPAHLLSSPANWQVPQWSLAAMILFLVGGIAYWFGQQNAEPSLLSVMDQETEQGVEPLISGHASLRRSLALRWTAGTPSYREGDVLQAGKLQFEAGVAEIDLFCGATLIVEGPAHLVLESDWSVQVIEGRLRASVPPAARGFVIKAVGSEIVDLGTEFALEVGEEDARLEVVDGEVELRGGDHDGQLLTTGQRQWLKGTPKASERIRSLSTLADVQSRRASAQQARLAEWKAYYQILRNDERLIAYYPIADSRIERVVPNAAATGGDFDGHLVGSVNRTEGRFELESTGLSFERPGARVRTRIDGEFQAFTFSCWVKIDGLDHRYNALFMGDGYENGEPHWQIRDDGRLMFSIMVDDTKDVRYFNAIDQKVVKDAGLHRVYLTEQMWDLSKSGQWFHLAAVYDPANRRVLQYVNGEKISQEPIRDDFYVSTLRIGPAEIGNWGQPFRKSPWFAVRNLNGTIDELAIFNAALLPQEIHSLFEKGKPLGY